MTRLLFPLLLLTLFISCNSGSGSSDECYEENSDTTQFGLLGSWYKVGISEGKVNKVGCFIIDTTGMKSNLMNELSFTIGGKQYSYQGFGGSSCSYDVSPDYKTLYNFDLGADRVGDTTKTMIGLLNREYLVLIYPADTTFFKDAKTMSILYMRKTP